MSNRCFKDNLAILMKIQLLPSLFDNDLHTHEFPLWV